MNNFKERRGKCFDTVFPAEGEISQSTQATVQGWDSIAPITLVNVSGDEIQIQMNSDPLEIEMQAA